MNWSDDSSLVAGWFVGIIVFAALFVFALNVSDSNWQWNIKYRHNHPLPGWAIHTGSIVDTSAPSFSNSPPEVNSTVKFIDYFGQSQEVNVNMPYHIKVGDKTEVDVSKTGSIFVPHSFDYQGDLASWKGPRAAVAGLYPGGMDTIFGVLALIIAAVIGCLTYEFCYDQILPSVKGRLGTR